MFCICSLVEPKKPILAGHLIIPKNRKRGAECRLEEWGDSKTKNAAIHYNVIFQDWYNTNPNKQVCKFDNPQIVFRSRFSWIPAFTGITR